MALDLYIYLRGGRGDGFVPQWDGTIEYVDRQEFSTEYTVPTVQSTVKTADGSQISASLLINGISDLNKPSYIPIGTVEPIAALRTVSVTSATPNDVTPKQFTRQVKWRRYRGQGGLYFEFREDLVIGHGGAARSS